MSRRLSTMALRRPTMAMENAEAMAPGRMISPVCHAVMCSMFWRKMGRMNTEPNSPAPSTMPMRDPAVN